MLFNSKELIEQKNDLITRAEDTVNKAKNENRELTDDEMAELAEIRDNVRKIAEKMKINEDMDNMDEKQPKPEPKPAGESKEDNMSEEDKQKQQAEN